MSALDYYIEIAPENALGFIDDIERAYEHIQSFPDSGSTRYAFELDLPDLRLWQCHQFPYWIFYFNHPQQIEVWRVLDSKKDIPPSLQAAIF